MQSEKAAEKIRRFLKMNFCIKTAKFINNLQISRKKALFYRFCIDFCRNC